ncbi:MULTISPECIES: hypothetical protein [unclassified Streptomyces]|uniref:hypothetical protein n=1 Tax=unclassified Streptomyces TaxID=2593676 RepID=UPI0016618642|nr:MULTISPECIES: hypothetical protein [unclassified Streptomyces]
MRNYTLTLFLIVLAPSMTIDAINRISDGGWARLWGVIEAAVAAAIAVGAAGEIRKGWKKKRAAE